jgi:hypothetical protein
MIFETQSSEPQLACVLERLASLEESMEAQRLRHLESRAGQVVWMRAGRVHVGQTVLDLSRRPMSQKLFRHFLCSEGFETTIQDLLAGVYGVDVQRGVSKRLAAAAHESLIKLVSRARKEAYRTFRPIRPHWQWFPFDHSSGVWKLYTSGSGLGEPLLFS